ncbi:Coenzyme F420 hydrogenase/dehydrogenase, beta subunit C-terminal domain [Defluviimonas sp. D31]|nr:Coenzyme F420 hydrogenase/dehydrogenase, beta subunit C-terminal domain [Defluviimonas sp. D31]
MIAPDKISMHEDSDGFLRPRISRPLEATEDTLVHAVCPGLGQTVSAGGRKDDILWGPYISVQSGWSTDPEIRFAGSSGGVLSALANYLIRSGRVDAVLETCAASAPVTANAEAVVTDRLGVLAAAGSRYAPSAPLAHLRDHVATGRRFAIVGKPCDAAAMRALADNDPEIARSVPVILSFFCAGVPSGHGGAALLRALDTRPADAKAFRYRGNGWPGRATVIRRDGTERSMTYQDSWGSILSREVQHRCRICADGTGCAADLVCGDAWECDEAGYPVFEEADGISLIVARTELGATLLNEAVRDGAIAISPFRVSRLASIQPGQRERRRALLARLLGQRLCLRPIPCYRGLHLFAAARQNAFSRNLRNFLGMTRRQLSGRASAATQANND